jgi:hypothetical protein
MSTSLYGYGSLKGGNMISKSRLFSGFLLGLLAVTAAAIPVWCQSIREPSFETVNYWTNPSPNECYRVHKPTAGNRSLGITDGEYAYVIRADTWHGLTPKYIYQDQVDLSDVQSIVFDWTACDEHVYGGARVFIKFNNTVIWEHDIWEGNSDYDYQQHLNETIDVSSINYSGRVLLVVETASDWAEVIFDNFRTVGAAQPPILSLTCGTLSCEANGGTISFSWSATDDHTPSSDIQYRYKLDDGAWYPWRSYVKKRTYRSLKDGNHTFYVQARDESGNLSEKTCAFSVQCQELQRPIANFSFLPENPVVKDAITFDATSSTDPDGTIVLYEWDFNSDGVYETASAAASTVTHAFNVGGQYVVTLRVTDNDGLSATSSKSIRVTEATVYDPYIYVHTSSPTTYRVFRNTSVRFALRAVNRGTATDTLVLSAESPRPVDLMLSDSRLTLGPGASKTVYLTVSGENDTAVTVTATSQQEPSKIAECKVLYYLHNNPWLCELKFANTGSNAYVLILTPEHDYIRCQNWLALSPGTSEWTTIVFDPLTAQEDARELELTLELREGIPGVVGSVIEQIVLPIKMPQGWQITATDFKLDRDGYFFPNDQAFIELLIPANCHGFASTSILYYNHWEGLQPAETPPLPHRTYALPESEEVWDEIREHMLLQWHQIIKLLTGQFTPNLVNEQAEYDLLDAVLWFGRPAILALKFAKEGIIPGVASVTGHNVTAYKTVVIDRKAYILFYDNNFPCTGDFSLDAKEQEFNCLWFDFDTGDFDLVTNKYSALGDVSAFMVWEPMVELIPSTEKPTSHTYGATGGWTMVSVPLNSGTPSELFGATVYHWNPVTGEYEVPASIAPTAGYWAQLAPSQVVVDSGPQITEDVIIDIAATGWHQVSTPWSYPKVAVQVIRDTQMKTWDHAVAAGWIANAIYGYKPEDADYTSPSTLNPWYGYWLKALVDGLSLKLLYTASTPVSAGFAPIMELKALLVPTDLPSMPSAPAVSTAALEFINIPNPITDVHTTTFMVKGVMMALVEAIKVQIFDLSGRLVYEEEEAGTSMDWHTENNYGETLANGVYLYRMYALIGEDWVESEVKKLVILR